MITDAGIEALGSWEPLPTGSALVDYWRGRLGKAERLILETLTQVDPDALTKEEVAVKAGYEANGGGFNNAPGPAEDAGTGPGARRDQGQRQPVRCRVKDQAPA